MSSGRPCPSRRRRPRSPDRPCPGPGYNPTFLPWLLLAVILAGLAPEHLSAQVRRKARTDPSEEGPGSRVAIGYAADLFVPGRGEWSETPAILDNLDLLLHLDLEEALGLPGTSLRIHVQSNRGDAVSAEVGDLQGVSNLQAPEKWRLYEAWIEQPMGPSGTSLLAGVWDINAEFDVIPAAGDFLNGAFGFGPEYSLSGTVGPSTYPATGLAARLRLEPRPDIYGLLAVSDGAPSRPGSLDFSLDREDGGLLSAEIGYVRPFSDPSPGPGWASRPDRRGGGRGMARGGPGPRRQRRRIGRGRVIQEVATKIAAGAWLYTSRLPAWTTGAPSAHGWGLYLLGEHRLSREENGTGGLSGFARIGTAADEVNRVSLSLGGGLTYTGLLPGRPDDVTGLGVAHARNGSPYLRAQRQAGFATERAETVVELTHRVQLGSAFVIQPDLQWVKNPGMDPSSANALVFGVRGHLFFQLPSGDRDGDG